MNSILTI